MEKQLQECIDRREYTSSSSYVTSKHEWGELIKQMNITGEEVEFYYQECKHCGLINKLE